MSLDRLNEATLLNNDEKLGLLVRVYVELVEEGKITKTVAIHNLMDSVNFFRRKEEAQK
jgi:hypothetical protein